MSLWDIIVESWECASDKVEGEYREKNRMSPGCVIRHDRDLYYHYGIYAGHREIIHFSEGMIRRQTLESMVNRSWGYFEVMGFSDAFADKYTLRESLERAESCIGMSGYTLFNNNCEHFAIWCRTGHAFSAQAFGSRSEQYDREGFLSSCIATGFSALGAVTGVISKMYEDEVGMGVTRTVSLEYINDD